MERRERGTKSGSRGEKRELRGGDRDERKSRRQKEERGTGEEWGDNVL